MYAIEIGGYVTHLTESFSEVLMMFGKFRKETTDIVQMYKLEGNMRRFKALGNWQYGEREIEEIGTGKRYTLTQCHKLTSSDYYHIDRTIAVPHQEGNTEYIYELSYMGKANPGSVLHMDWIDEEALIQLVRENTEKFLRCSGMDNVFCEYFGKE